MSPGLQAESVFTDFRRTTHVFDLLIKADLLNYGTLFAQQQIDVMQNKICWERAPIHPNPASQMPTPVMYAQNSVKAFQILHQRISFIQGLAQMPIHKYK